jgi:hypothetical protein
MKSVQKFLPTLAFMAFLILFAICNLQAQDQLPAEEAIEKLNTLMDRDGAELGNILDENQQRVFVRQIESYAVVKEGLANGLSLEKAIEYAVISAFYFTFDEKAVQKNDLPDDAKGLYQHLQQVTSR